MKKLILVFIRFYQFTLSALIGRTCRFLPTCSDYATEAIEKHGVICGGQLALRRVSRCHPWGASGFDPVPDTCSCCGKAKAQIKKAG